jgi:aspartate racemase
MKTIGLIGGMSWEASAVYYQRLNRAVQQRLGGLHSARIAMISLDFAEPAEYARRSQ